jgi:hypothetical protein
MSAGSTKQASDDAERKGMISNALAFIKVNEQGAVTLILEDIEKIANRVVEKLKELPIMQTTYHA